MASSRTEQRDNYWPGGRTAKIEEKKKKCKKSNTSETVWSSEPFSREGLGAARRLASHYSASRFLRSIAR